MEIGWPQKKMTRESIVLKDKSLALRTLNDIERHQSTFKDNIMSLTTNFVLKDKFGDKDKFILKDSVYSTDSQRQINFSDIFRKKKRTHQQMTWISGKNRNGKNQKCHYLA